MIFKHELMHAWHWSSSPNTYKYTERATSTYSYVYARAYNEAWMLDFYKPNIKFFPQHMGWREFNKIVPLWIK
jgi:hypothetical protein